MTISPLPTVRDFKMRFTEFETTSGSQVEFVISEAARLVDDGWAAADQVMAVLYLTAHMLTQERIAFAAASVGDVAGPITRLKVGDAEKQYSDAQLSGTTGTASLELGKTYYGRQFIMIRKRNVSGVLNTAEAS